MCWTFYCQRMSDHLEAYWLDLQSNHSRTSPLPKLNLFRIIPSLISPLLLNLSVQNIPTEPTDVSPSSATAQKSIWIVPELKYNPDRSHVWLKNSASDWGDVTGVVHTGYHWSALQSSRQSTWYNVGLDVMYFLLSQEKSKKSLIVIVHFVIFISYVFLKKHIYYSILLLFMLLVFLFV